MEDKDKHRRTLTNLILVERRVKMWSDKDTNGPNAVSMIPDKHSVSTIGILYYITNNTCSINST
jgi:hypothetical protein